MKTLLAATLAALLASTAAMVATRPADGRPGRVPLVWVTDQNPTRTDEIGHFVRHYPNLDLRLDPGNTDTQKVIVQAQAGVGPDLFDYWGEAAKNAYVKSGIAWDVTDALRTRGLDMKRIVWPLALPWTVQDGRIYAVPANVGVDAIWLRQDLFEQAGVPLPKAGLEPGRPCAPRGPHDRARPQGPRQALWIPHRLPRLLERVPPEFGGDMFDAKGIRCTVADPPSVACLQFDRDLIYRWRVSPSPNDEHRSPPGAAGAGRRDPRPTSAGASARWRWAVAGGSSSSGTTCGTMGSGSRRSSRRSDTSTV